MPPIKAVLFDLDDTLNDRGLSWGAFVPRLRQQYAQQLAPCEDAHIKRAFLAADWNGYRNKEELFTELRDSLPWRSAPPAHELEAFWRSCFADCMVEREGAIELIKDLRAHVISTGIITNGRADMQSAKIANLGLTRLVDAIVISEPLGIKKPDARIFQTALAKLDCHADSALFVGDHAILDIGGAKAVGMRTAWITLSRKWEQGDPPNFRICHLHQLRKIVKI
ncbi:MAG TPA: HAD family hydrolase [Tepidisphaeraceae bacterium]